MFTYFVSMPFGEIDAGKSFSATAHVNVPYQVIDLVSCGDSGTFQFDSIFFGDESMFCGASSVPVDMFFPSVQNRGIREKWLRLGDTVQMRASNTSGKKATLTVCLKVKSYRRAS
jgi:hypothetical protein